MKFTYFLLLLCVLSMNTAFGKNSIYTKQDSLLFKKYVSSFKDKSNKPIDKLFIETALYFQGTPYVASTLDKNKKEELVISLGEFDCTTFVETCLALTRVAKKNDLSFVNYANQLAKVRYRGGVIDGYSSRLHYVTDWIYDNQKEGIITDVTLSIGGVNDDKQIDFMSTYRDKYARLKSDNLQLAKIINIEDAISQRKSYNYIPKSKINSIKSQIKDGDIIVFATSIKGLDYTHIGIAYHVNGELRFIHASTKGMEVIVEPSSLSDYCAKSSKCIGITVLRLNDIKNDKL